MTYTIQIMPVVYVIILLVLDNISRIMNPKAKCKDPVWNMFTKCEMNSKHAA